MHRILPIVIGTLTAHARMVFGCPEDSILHTNEMACRQCPPLSSPRDNICGGSIHVLANGVDCEGGVADLSRRACAHLPLGLGDCPWPITNDFLGNPFLTASCTDCPPEFYNDKGICSKCEDMMTRSSTPMQRYTLAPDGVLSLESSTSAFKIRGEYAALGDLPLECLQNYSIEQEAAILTAFPLLRSLGPVVASAAKNTQGLTADDQLPYFYTFAIRCAATFEKEDCLRMAFICAATTDYSSALCAVSRQIIERQRSTPFTKVTFTHADSFGLFIRRFRANGVLDSFGPAAFIFPDCFGTQRDLFSDVDSFCALQGLINGFYQLVIANATHAFDLYTDKGETFFFDCVPTKGEQARCLNELKLEFTIDPRGGISSTSFQTFYLDANARGHFQIRLSIITSPSGNNLSFYFLMSWLGSAGGIFVLSASVALLAGAREGVTQALMRGLNDAFSLWSVATNIIVCCFWLTGLIYSLKNRLASDDLSITTIVAVSSLAVSLLSLMLCALSLRKIRISALDWEKKASSCWRRVYILSVAAQLRSSLPFHPEIGLFVWVVLFGLLGEAALPKSYFLFSGAALTFHFIFFLLTSLMMRLFTSCPFQNLVDLCSVSNISLWFIAAPGVYIHGQNPLGTGEGDLQGLYRRLLSEEKGKGQSRGLGKGAESEGAQVLIIYTKTALTPEQLSVEVQKPNPPLVHLPWWRSTKLWGPPPGAWMLSGGPGDIRSLCLQGKTFQLAAFAGLLAAAGSLLGGFVCAGVTVVLGLRATEIFFKLILEETFDGSDKYTPHIGF